jgi:peptidoglycan/LPS O-acetylase OafA/YrhL
VYLLQVPIGTLRIDGDRLGTVGGAWLHLGFILLLVACAIALHLLFERPLQRAIRDAYARRRERAARREPARRQRDASDRVL